MYKIAIETLGCRLNQAESAILQSRFAEKGYALTTDPLDADLFVLHTCTLTGQATSKSRRRLRWVARRNPDACVAAIGCYAQTDADALARIPGVDFVVGTAHKLRLPDIISAPVKLPEPTVINNPATKHGFEIAGTGVYPLHTRANLKIQEGCDFVCAFCIIPRARGRARSRDYRDILREARKLAAAGHRELVITGVNVGTYNDGGRTLADVVKALCDIEPLDRIRISSIEPTTIEDALLDEMAAGGKLCRYLHVPLQSGDSRTLSRMRRRYDADVYRAFMEDAVARVPGIGLGTDVMVGFPGESEAAFERSCEMVRALPFVNVHVFSFSARPRTSAYGMDQPVPAARIQRRSEYLRRLALARQHATYLERTNGVMDVLFEGTGDGGLWTGFSDSYIRVRVQSPENLSNRIARVAVKDVELDGNAERVVAVGDIRRES
ncbi:MAG: tRNA (N(6)-L-threonylcarbamoyladenosine(37)-C(2))-methylthiotransferase MtaB [Candidatus Krumholzibacteria bacterium]|nr:tRNA (N(6)-L-threonylcarbamoyladenosine(37)-C(2))-methylthiotransferase MtaB [Candidatus Krumholzibacteria bacterium]MDH4337429.1 tRNA (N(6)-L-threonylcarbamoyladenosine(37)-C(2))-methylthiotransferase MtaB [Candidatus Krumholzibacteria bacterium]MDH5271122.1 tRNA (N(6)-L-threonylcarbamoyladenosine(37)-C(2))-methylthiotransferase MtaB [Candidatus Krumholzibacteria bacterium]